MYTFQPVSDRMMRLRKIYRETYPQVSVERVRIVTDFYQQHPDEPILLKRAKLLMEVVRQSTLRVEEDELIVGNIAPTYRGATLLPELGIDWLYDELRDGSFESRGDTEEGYYIAPEDKAYLFTTEAYWRKHSVSAGMACAAPDGLKSTYGSGVISYGGVNMCTTPVGHFNTNYDKVLYKGFGKVRDEARAKMDELEGRIFGNDAEKYVFYKSVTIVCDAAIHLAVRYAALCRKKANEASGDRRKELIQMASSLEWILENPCRTYWEAAQALFLYQIIMTLDAANHALSIGRLDQYLWPYLEADLEKNRITISAAQEIMDCLFLKIADINKIWPLAGARNSGAYSSGQHISLGGLTKDGKDATNPVSYFMLESVARLALHDPPLSLRIHKDTPQKLWEASVETSKRVGGLPTLQNDEVIIPALIQKGFSLEDARNYCIIGCVEPAGTGCEWSACGGSGKESYWNMANALLLAINNGINPLTGAQAGLKTGYLYEMKTFEAVQEAYTKQVHYFVDWHVTMTNISEMVTAGLRPLPVVSAMMDGCMETGTDVTRGGAKYNSTGISGIGCANVADTLSVIKYMIFDQKKYTGRQIYDAFMADWKDYEPLRQEIFNCVPRYGNDDPYVDEIARWAMDVYSDYANTLTGMRGEYRPGLYPVSAHIAFGKNTAAMPDGRHAHEPLADGVSPMQGLDRNGPASILKSVGRLNHQNNGNGTLLNMKFHPKSLEGADSAQKLIELIKTYFGFGGMHLQYNVISSDTLRSAQQNPEEYKDLVIRIAGFSAYFVELYKDLQDDLIRRTDLSI